MTELILGTKKGLFVVDGSPESGFDVTTRAFAGEPVDYARRDPRTGRLFATVSSPFYGPKIWYADDPAGEWTQAEGVTLPEGGDAALERIWVITPGQEDGLLYAGGDPGVLFESHDDGATWELNEALFNHPTRNSWQPGGGGLCLHSIVPWPGDPQRLLVAVSAAGVWLTEDAGRSWRQGNRGLNARYLPEETRATATNLCVHHISGRQADPSGCSCSSTAACIAPTTRARAGLRSAAAWCLTSGSRWRSIQRIPTAPTSSPCAPTWTA